MSKPLHKRGLGATGFSLIELLVAMAIGLIVTLAITSVLIRSEGSKRGTTSVNDINQTGAYAAYLLDRVVRSAGTGYSQNWFSTYGCLLNAYHSTTPATQVLPPTIASTSTFAGVTSTSMPIRLAPVVIGKGLAPNTGGDILMVMAGTGGAAEVPLTVTPGSVTASQLQVLNNLGYQTGNVILLADPAVGCMVQQVGTGLSPATQIIPLGGTYYKTVSNGVSLTSFGANTTVAQLGLDATNPPQFQMFGVGANNTLYSYDLLQPGGNEQAIADGIVEMRAIYGLDTDSTPDGKINTWVDATGSYAPSALMNGTPASQTLLRQIVAIRLGFFLRTSLQERAVSTTTNPEGYTYPAGTPLTLFPDDVDASGNSLAQQRTPTGSDLSYRWRTIEITVPLINVLNAPTSPTP